MPPDEHVLQHRHLIEQPLVLECAREPERGDGVRWSPGQLVLPSPKRMLPPVARKMPVTRLKIVVLPDPFGPISPTISPSFIREVEALDGLQPAERLLQPGRLEQRHGRRRAGRLH